MITGVLTDALGKGSGLFSTLVYAFMKDLEPHRYLPLSLSHGGSRAPALSSTPASGEGQGRTLGKHH